MSQDLKAQGLQVGVSGTEVAAIAIANEGSAWTSDGCAAFVWGVTNLAGLPFFDPHSNRTDYTVGGDPRVIASPVNGFFVPHMNPAVGSRTPDISGDGWADVYDGSSALT